MIIWQADQVKPSSNSDAVVKKRHAIVCWSCVAAHKHSIDSAKHGTHDITNQTDVNVKAEKTDIETAQLVSISMEELDLQESDNDDDTDRGENEPALNETDEDQAVELLETLTDNPHEPSSSSSQSQDPPQLYPPGRIMHMVGLPSSSEPNSTSEQGEEVVALYETPRHLYSKIRLARSMIREHYMPKYIRTMELLIDKLVAEEEDGIDDDHRLGSL